MKKNHPEIQRHAGTVFSRQRGLTGTNILALIVCFLSLVIMGGSGVYYYSQRSKARAAEILMKQKQNEIFFFHEPKSVAPADANRMINSAMTSLEGFLRTSGIAEKSAYVSRGYLHIGKMNEYYGKKIGEIMPREPKLVNMGMLNVNGTDCLMIVLEFKNKTKWELDFFKDPNSDIWKLDWPAFVRYQEVDWKDFIHGNSPVPQGAEFRVWALRDKTEEDANHYAVRFIEPAVNGSDKQGVFSPPVLVKKQSDIGKQLYRYFAINEFEDTRFKILSSDDDKKYLRLRVVLSKQPTEADPSKMSIKLDKIIGQGWYDDPPNS